MTPKKMKVYPSSSSFALPGGVITLYDSGCMRSILINSKTRSNNFPPLYAEIGQYHEDLFAAQLGNRLAKREFVVKSDILANVENSGRLDFQDIDGVIYETKASLSESFYYSVIRKGEYKLYHMAQLVTYMIALQQPKGVIVCGYYEQGSGDVKFTQSGYREFVVEIRDGGKIFVDGTDSGYTVKDQLRWQHLAANVLATDSIGDRPVNAWEPQGSPCRYCPMSSICDSYDMGEISKDELVSQGIEAVKNKRMPEPKVNPVKKRRLPK